MLHEKLSNLVQIWMTKHVYTWTYSSVTYDPDFRLFKWLLHEFDNVVGDIFGEKVARISFNGISFGIDEEFFKIPRDVGSRHGTPNDVSRIAHQGHRVVTGRWHFFPEPLEDGVGVGSVDIDFLHERGSRLKAVSGSDVAKVESNLFAIAVLLMSKLITRESQDHEAIAEALQQLVHLQVIPGGRASQRGHV